MKPFAFVLDVDGTVTDGAMLYDKDGKFAKSFGPDDWCLLAEVRKVMPVHFITADTKGFPITQRRIEEECDYPLDVVPNEGISRWNAIRSFYPEHNIIFMGDGCKDWYCLMQSYYSITTSDALNHVKYYADFVTEHSGGKRAVAEACINIIHIFNLPAAKWLPERSLDQQRYT